MKNAHKPSDSECFISSSELSEFNNLHVCLCLMLYWPNQHLDFSQQGAHPKTKPKEKFQAVSDALFKI
jgi:hypothetical protein